ncbi:hypothetical protein M885DRAFT_499772 [Pelagophyceae sp. CCMP2097]|nr:hypothetical protein M885DRAFT_499772 [Pelagophyceae sp. CCMP2097]
MPLSWFLNSKVPGFEGTLWAATHGQQAGPNLRDVFARDFSKYAAVEKFAGQCTSLFTLAWAPWKRGDTMSMYTNHTGLGMLNPLNVVPLYTLCRAVGVTEAWWDIVFTPHYTASFLVDELRPFPAVFAPIIEAQIPLLPTAQNSWQGASSRSAHDCNITTCVTWKDAGTGIRAVFKKMCQDVDVRTDTRVCNVTVLPNGAKRVLDEHGGVAEVERVVFACPCNAIGNMYPQRSAVTEVVLNAPVYADDHHPATGHMHAVMHSDDTVIDERYRADFLKRGSNYVEITRLADGPGVYDLPLEEKPVMLISHALGEGKSIDESKIRGGGNHARERPRRRHTTMDQDCRQSRKTGAAFGDTVETPRAHPLYSGWNVAAQLSLRLAQGTDGARLPPLCHRSPLQHRFAESGVYYCSNWATPGNCHDMSLLSGFLCAAAIGAAYPFPREVEAKKDFYRLNELMGVF